MRGASFESLKGAAAGIRLPETLSVFRWMPAQAALVRLTPVTDSAGPELTEAPVHTPLTPIFIGLRISLHGIFVALTTFMVVRAILLAGAEAPWVIALGFVLLAAYLAGAFLARSATSPVGPRVWLAVLTTVVLALVPLTPDATFLIFPLFFLQLHLLPFRWAIPVIVATTAFAIVVFAGNSGWTVGGVLGPAIGATVAIVIGLGYRALYREARQRQLLIDELLATREMLALREREAGVLQERSRLAREIHDTVAQGLSSIQMLLHAAEREGSGQAALEHVRLARETAATNLAEARRFIRELTPPALEQQTIGAALARLAEANTVDSLAVTFHSSGEPVELPMRLETALLRIAQATLANVRQHANAGRAEITLTYLDNWVGLDIVDDGRGFSPRAIDAAASERTSFGLTAMSQRVEQLGGTLTIESRPGAGTAIAVGFELIGGPE
jgi:signal transduction histidine kinase